MTSTKQVFANRQNAQHSTGPKTESGKQTSSRNALRHGLAAEYFVVGEDPEQVDELLQELIDKYQPDSSEEVLLLERVVHGMLNRQRGEHLMQREFLAARNGRPGSIFTLSPNIRRYIKENDRSVEQAFALFFRNRAELRKQNKAFPIPKPANGFVPEEISLSERKPFSRPALPLETQDLA